MAGVGIEILGGPFDGFVGEFSDAVLDLPPVLTLFGEYSDRTSAYELCGFDDHPPRPLVARYRFVGYTE